MTNELLGGWVILNGLTIGSGASGATQRANGDTQNLFVYLWTNCTDAHCPVVGGRGATALGDFNANKQITLPDLRARMLAGRDCMNNAACAGRLLSSNIASGEGVDTPAAVGGVANQTAKSTFSILQSNLPAVNFSVSGITLTNGTFNLPLAGNTGLSGNFAEGSTQTTSYSATSNVSVATQGTAASGGSGTSISTTSAPFATMPPFLLGTFYMRL